MKKLVNILWSISMLFGLSPQVNTTNKYSISSLNKILDYKSYSITAQDDGKIFGLHGNFEFTVHFQIEATISPSGQINIRSSTNAIDIISLNTHENYLPQCEISAFKINIENNRFIISYIIKTDIDLTKIIPNTFYEFQFEYLSN